VRLTRFRLFLLGGLILTIVGPVAFTQGPGGFGGGGFGGGFGKGGKGGFRGPDPEAQFKMYSGGKDVIVVAEVVVPERMARWMTTEQLRERMNAYLQKKGITNGQMTLEQYKDYSDEQRREMMEKFRNMGPGGFKMGGGPPGATPTPAAPGAATPGTAAPAPPSAAEIEAQAKQLFERLDTDKDGKLSLQEMESARNTGMSNIYDVRERYDADKDGKIDLKEFTAYFMDRMRRGGGGPGGAIEAEGEKQQEEEKRPVVYRVGNLPKELLTQAPWFEELDKDKDGQVGLYEWKSAGRPIKDFLAMDANGDGFLTAEEMLRYLKVNKKDDKNAKQGSTRGRPTGTTPGSPSIVVPIGRGPGGPGNRGPRMRGPGAMPGSDGEFRPKGKRGGGGPDGGGGRGKRGGGGPDGGGGRGKRGGGGFN
jgi:hypothetical protein